MKYYINLDCRACSRRGHKIDDQELVDRIKEANEDDTIDELWFNYAEETDWECDCDQEYAIQDRFNLTVTDEDNNTIYETNKLDDIKLVDEGGKTRSIFSKGLWFVRESTWKGAGWIYSMEIDEPFDSSKLYFTKTHYYEDNNYDIRYVNMLSYEGIGYLEIEEENGWFEEQYYDEKVVAVLESDSSMLLDIEDLDEYYQNEIN